MRKKLTLTIDSDVYDQIKDLPRDVSISEIVSWLLKIAMEEIKIDKRMTAKELHEWLDSTPEGMNYKHRFNERYKPAIQKILMH